MITSSRVLRLLLYATLVALEATLAHVFGLLFASGGTAPILRWWVLVVVVGVSALATVWVEPMHVDRSRIRSTTAVLALLVIWWATTVQADASVRALWRTLGRLLDLDSDRFFATYLALGASMWCWWRGSRIVDRGHAEVVRLFQRALIGLLVVIGLLSIAGYDPGFQSNNGVPRVGLLAELIGFLVLALVSLSLARIEETSSQGGDSQWRWLRSGLLSTAGVIMLGVALLALLADPAAVLLRTVVRSVIYGVVLLLSPIIALILTLIEFIRRALPQGNPETQLLPTATATATEPTRVGEQVQVPEILLALPTIILLLLPIIALLLLILFTQRRRDKVVRDGDEERESIFSWGAVRDDLAGFLRGLQPRGDLGGLQGALRRLAGADPATRIRRRYVQLLLRGEAAGHQRPTAATPHEFAPTLGSRPGDDAPVATLTQMYEQARYAPATVDETAARLADTAWSSLANNQATDPPSPR